MRISDWSSDVCSSDLPETSSYLTGNAASATSKGIEGSLSIFPIPNFDITASGAYQDIAYDDYPGAACLAAQVADGSCVPTDPTSIANKNLAGSPPANTHKPTRQAPPQARSHHQEYLQLPLHSR